jgi:arylsulfatase A-like enzyme
MDLLPTLAALCGGELPHDRDIDGRDISSLLRTPATAASPHEAFFYYLGNDLEAVRAGRWKLHVSKAGHPVAELYDLEADVGETTDLPDAVPEVVAELRAHLVRARVEIGDRLVKRRGRGARPAGRVDDPVTLTVHDPNHPYYVAMYDLPQRG